MLALGKLERLNVRQGLNLTTPPTKHTHTHTHTTQNEPLTTTPSFGIRYIHWLHYKFVY